MHPLAIAALTMIGERAFSELIDRFSPPSPAEQALQQQVEAGQSVIPTLQAQARGEPTAGTRAIEQRIGMLASRAQQAYGASQRRASGTAVGTPSRAQAGRLQAAGIQSLTQELGASQRYATAALAGMGAGAPAQLAGLEAQKSAAYSGMISDIGTIYGEYQNMQREEERDEWYTNMYNELIATIRSISAGNQGNTPRAGPPELTPWEREARSRPLGTT